MSDQALEERERTVILQMTALRLLAKGFAPAEVADATGLASETVEGLEDSQRTGPRRALLYLDRQAFVDDALPGSVWFSDAGDSGVAAMWFHCPCGCGARSRITVGIGHKPHHGGATWHWDGSNAEPTLHPSVNHRAPGLCPGWHGWLRGGYWEKG